MRRYHLSYDVINVVKDFDNKYDDAKEFLLCVLGGTGPIEINSYNASSLIIDYNDFQAKLLEYLKTNLSSYYYFSLSLIAIGENGVSFIRNNPNESLKANLKDMRDKLSCEKFQNKKITPY